ncbi:DUF4935 domain-containing protein [Chryseobacterium sp. G0162]|uniref:PIN domain-containing protein n=1 Tax=Chryseobacterium sp. G0162 TaxID=2487063 RepID=UPI000F4EC710|nr:PIN domain-containing protein [Chryseobacterium sp. G0162]AZB11647.1 DUF4935 domain-containing protein [Chryseobacterium sp. G0162]
MNIFIDSNILYQDYFFENKSNKKLLDYCNEGLLNLYMSEIVRLELRRQLQKELENKNKELEKLSKELKRLNIQQEINLIPTDEHLEKFDNFYKRLNSNENFFIIQYKNEFLPDIVNRAINRKKPFTEEKSELKDALIWKTYSDFVETHNSLECILLTNNTSDFCDKKDKTKIHRELETDTNKFSVINSSYDFIRKNAAELESPDKRFLTYMKQVDINNLFAFEIISENFEEIIEEAMRNKIDGMHPSDITNADYFLDGQLVSYGCEILECEGVEYEILNETALISGIIYASCEVEILEYNSIRDPGEDQYTSVGELNVTFKIHFNFDMRKDEIYSDFEITGIDISDTN